MKNLIALTLLIVVLANNVNCDRAPPARGPPARVPPARVPINGPSTNSPNIVIPTRPTGSPTRQTMSITRAPPVRTTISGTAPSPTRAPPSGSTTGGPTVGPIRPTTTRQNIELTTTKSPVPSPSPQPPQPPIELPLIPTAPIVTGMPPAVTLPPMSTLPPNVRTTLPPRVGPFFPDPRCPAESGKANPTQLPHHSDCNRFFKCDHGIAYEYRCPVGQHWNAARNWCDFPNLAGCSINGNVQMPIDNNGPINIPMAPPVSSPQVGGIPEPRCPHTPTPLSPLGEMNLTHPGNCNKYLKCVQGLAYEQICPAGQHWNSNRNACDMPQSANCQLGHL